MAKKQIHKGEKDKMDLFSESNKLKQAMLPFLRKVIAQETKECLRVYKARVTTAPNASTGDCGVTLVGQSTELLLPYSTAINGVTVGEMVWVATTYDSWRNAVVWQKIDFN